MKSKIKVLSESAWVVAGQLVAVVGSLLLIGVLTDHLSPQEYGQLVLVLTLAIFINQTLVGGLVVSIGRYYSIASEYKDIKSYLSEVRRLMLHAGMIISTIGILLILTLYVFNYSQWVASVGLTVLFSIISGCNTALGGIQNAARQRKTVAMHVALESVLKLGLVLVLCELNCAFIESVLLVYVIAALVTTISQIYFIKRISINNAAKTDKGYWEKEIWMYAVPFATWGPFTWLQQISDRWALELFSSEGKVGQYAVVYQIGFTPIALATGMAVNLIGPILFQRSGDGKDKNRNKEVNEMSWNLTYLALTFTCAGFLLTLMLHESIFSILVHADYRQNSYLLPWLVLAGGIYAAGQTLSLKIMSEMRVSSMLYVKIITAIIGVVLNIAGASLFGVDGVVVGMVIFSGIFLIWMLLLSRDNKYKERVN